MATFKLFVLAAILAVSIALPAEYYGGPASYDDKAEERDYKFSYNVKDDHTYNQQSRDEQKYGNTIKGQYTVLEPTGELRVVNYIADDYGFHADVQKQGGGGGGGYQNAPAYH